jgi:hypothetical protein
LLLFVILLPVLAACAPPVGNQEGNVTLSLPGGGSRAIAGEVLDKLVYVMVFSGPGGEQVTVTTLPGESSVTLTLSLGGWTVRANASVEGIPFGSGEAGFRVLGGRSNPVSLEMKTLGLTVAEPFSTITAIEGWLGSPELAYRGRSESDPIPLPVTLDFSGMGGTAWTSLLGAISSKDKFVALDLSACTLSTSNAVFNPSSTVSDGKNKIVSLVLPATATRIADGTTSDPTFKDFRALKSVKGGAVETIGEKAFYECTSLGSVHFPVAKTIGEVAFGSCTGLSSVNLPVAQTIGMQAFIGCTGLGSVSLPEAQTIDLAAFSGCTGLGSVSLPVVKTIGNTAFGNTGTGALTVTLDDTPPELGVGMFASVYGSKPVTVRVPSGVTDWTSKTGTFEDAENITDGPHWGEGFRGKGWDGTNYRTGTVNTSIFLRVETYAP